MLSNQLQYSIAAFTPPSVTITTTQAGVLNTTPEIQTIAVVASGGTFTITYSGQTTSALAYNASAATVQAALWALSNIADGDVTVTLSGTTYTLTWLDSLGNVAQPTATITSLVSTVGTYYAKGFRNVVTELFPVTSPSYKLFFVKSNTESNTKPDFANASSDSNQWSYEEIIDLNDGSAIDGTTGVTISATTTRSFEWNNNIATWVGIIVTNYSAGNLTGNILMSNNI